MTNGCFMKVKSIAECSPSSILQYFWPSLSDNRSWKPFYGPFESGCFRQVLLYSKEVYQREDTECKSMCTITLCLLRNFSCFFTVCWFFSKSTFSKNSFRNTIWVSNRLDQDQAWHYVRPDLDPNGLQKLSADDTECPTDWIQIRPDVLQQSDLGSYCLQYRLPKNISRWEEQTTKIMTGGLRVNP